VISTKYQHNDYFSKRENHKSSYTKMFFIVSIDGKILVSGQALVLRPRSYDIIFGSLSFYAANFLFCRV